MWKTGWWRSIKKKRMHLASVKNDLPVCPSLKIGSSLSFGVLNYFFLNTQGKEISSYLRSTSRKRDLWERYSVGAGWEQSWRPQAAHKPLNQAHKGKGWLTKVKAGWHKVFPALSPPVLTPSAKLFAGRLLKLWESCERNRRKTFLASQIHPQRAGCALLPMALWLKSLVLMWL